MFEFFKNIFSENNNKNEDNVNKSKKLSKALKDNITIFKKDFSGDETVIFREFENQHNTSLKCCAIFIDGLADIKVINDNIIHPIINSLLEDVPAGESLLDTVEKRIITSGSTARQTDIQIIEEALCYGSVILLINGLEKALVLDAKGWKVRTPEQPESEKAVRGPKEGFTESITTNLSLIRKRIKNPDLKLIFKELGVRTKTKICLCYLDELVNKAILDELIKRLDKVDLDSLLATGYIEEMIKDAPLSPFDTLGNTERPDSVCGKILEGRIAIICDDTPAALTVPFVFQEYFAVFEDYYEHFIYSSFNRLLRWFAFFMSTSIPAIYVALVTYHQELIPTPLLLSISAAQEGVPFPSTLEAFLMLITFEILREAGVRLPTPFGQAISIVGALVIGQAAVEAKFVSAPIVIVVALTGISSFLIPKMLGPIIITRFAFLISASFLGMYGYVFAVIGLFIHLFSLRSFGVPYMLNLGSINKQELKDTGIRAPLWSMYYRPKFISGSDPTRRKTAKLPKGK